METSDILASLEAAEAHLTDELGRVRSAIKELKPHGARGHTSVRQPAAKPKRQRRGTGMKSSSTRGEKPKRVTRKQQVIDLLTNHASEGGMTIPELAGEMKIEPNYLYRVMPKIKGAKMDPKTKKWKLG